MRRSFAVFGVALAALLVSGCAGTPTARVNAEREDLFLAHPNVQEGGAELWYDEEAEDRRCFSEGGLAPGRLTPRECVLLNVRAAGDRGDVRAVRRYVDQQIGFYEVRAHRQQRFADGLATVTFGSALGAGLAGRVGAATQRAWLAVAFAPILVTNVNANEPTRDLFHAGALALQAIDARYARMHMLLSALDSSYLTDDLPDCAKLADHVRAASNWAVGEDRSAILPEAQRMLADCNAVNLAHQRSMLFTSAARAASTHWATDFAGDALELDRVLIMKDRQFRSSPAETLGIIAGAPFRALDTILSGQDTTEALKKVQTAVAFGGMDMRLASAEFPARFDVPAPTNPLAPAVRARVIAPPRAAGQPTAAVVSGIVIDLEARAAELTGAQNRQAYRSSLIAELYAAAAATDLSFRYDVGNGLVTVDLAPPRPPPAVTPP